MKNFILTILLFLSISCICISQPMKSADIEEDKSSWFSKSLEFKGIAVQDDDWHIWGCSPIIGDDGKTHLFVARWPEETGHQGWYTHSQVAHYVGDTPEGPFKFSDVVVEGTGQDTWDKFAPHNPTIHKTGDVYALFYIANTGTEQRPSNQKIGLAISKSLYGPWKKVGKDGLILSPPTDSTFFNYKAWNGVNNPAFFQHPDGRFFLYFKSAKIMENGKSVSSMGLAISDKLEGPYIQLPNPITNNNVVIEDGYAFQYNGKICLVTTDNHGMIEFGGGLIWESEDGMSFSNPKQAFKRLPYYFGGTLPEQAFLTKGEIGSKFERPQILMIDGKPSYLYCPSGTNTDGGKGSAGYALKIREEFLPLIEKSSQKYEPTWESLKQHQYPEWFRDAKFGIYFHWGAYTVPAFGHEWYPEAMYDKLRWYKKNDMHEHHVKTYGDPSEFGYHDFIPMFKAEKFNAGDWADLFVKAGAKFAGPVAEHHDGFALWNSEVTSWNVGKRGPKRDITGELEKAIRKRGLKFITTFHHSRNRTREIEPGKWEGYYKFLMEHYPQIVEDPELAILYGYISEEQFLQNWRDKLIEVIDKYQPDLMWFDTWLDEIPEQNRKEYLAYYFNKSNEWGRDVVVTCKQDDLPREVAIQDFERGRANRILDWPWLTDDAISRDTWSYADGMVIKSTKTIVHELIDIVSKNGNLLLDISPRADGIIPEDQKQVLLGIGDWLKVNGEAIYNTRPWLVFGEGPSRLEKGGGFTGKMEYTSNDIRFTQSKDGKCLYAIVLGWSENRTITIKALLKESDMIKNISLIGHSGEIEWEKTKNGIKVKLPDTAPCKYAISLKVTLE